MKYSLKIKSCNAWIYFLTYKYIKFSFFVSFELLIHRLLFYSAWMQDRWKISTHVFNGCSLFHDAYFEGKIFSN